jgi:hypothetical protein
LIIMTFQLMLSGAQEEQGCKDHPMFSRISDFFIESCDILDFDSHTFTNKEGDETIFEGQKTRISYCLEGGGRARSFQEIWNNYAQAITKVGGTVEFTDDLNANLHLVKNDKEVWVQVHDEGGNCYTLTIVEKK